jgi:hypothetical protein
MFVNTTNAEERLPVVVKISYDAVLTILLNEKYDFKAAFKNIFVE